jgi:hypothetical protein
MEKNETVRNMMPGMMMDIMPHCVENMVPLFEQEKKDQFLSRLSSAMENVEHNNNETKEE